MWKSGVKFFRQFYRLWHLPDALDELAQKTKPQERDIFLCETCHKGRYSLRKKGPVPSLDVYICNNASCHARPGSGWMRRYLQHRN